MLGNPYRVLLIEDDDADAFLIDRKLRGMRNLRTRVRRATSLSEAKTLALAERPDVFLLDFRLPDTHGLNALAELTLAWPSVPVIMLTGLKDEAAAIEAVRHGAQEYLIKDEVTEALLARSIIYSIERQRIHAQLLQGEATYRSLLLQHENIEKSVAQHAVQQQFLAELSQLALRGASDASVAKTATIAVREGLRVPLVGFFDWFANRQELFLSAGCGWFSGLVGTHRVSLSEASLGRYTLAHGPTVVVQDLAADTRFHCPLLAAHGAVSGLSVLVQGSEAVFGVLIAFAREPRDFTPSDVNFVRSVANTFAMMIERRRAEQALQASEERLRMLAENAQDVIVRFRLRPEPTAEYVSPSVARMTGFDLDRFYNDPLVWLAVIHPDDRERIRQELFGTAELQKPIMVRILNQNGNVAWVEFRLRVYRNVQGEPEVLEGIGRDVSERQHLEEQLRQSQKIEAIGRLAGGVAHDFNNLLTIILSYADLLDRSLAADSPLRSDLLEIRRAAERASSLTSQLLSFSRRQVVQPRIMDLREAIREVEKMLDRVIGEDVRLSVEYPDEPLWVEADVGQLQQVCLNLTVNSRDAMPKGGLLLIAMRRDFVDAGRAQMHRVQPGDFSVLEVSDTGVGMTREVLEHAFEPFFTTKPNGTGLGLPTVYGIVTQANGFLEIHSAPGQGTRVLVYLPAVPAPKPARSTPVVLPPNLGGRERVLLVEDDAGIRRLIGDYLSHLGYQVEVASDGVEALRKFGSCGAFDLVVSDLVMPMMGGLDLVKRLQELEIRVPVLLISGYSPTQPVGVPFLPKPFSMETLARKVRDVLDAVGSPPPTLESG